MRRSAWTKAARSALTAWEPLFEGLRVPITPGTPSGSHGPGDARLVVGGAGGVGSILVQLAKALNGLTVVATASREETRAWCRRMGADHVIDHRGDLKAQLDRIGVAPRFVAPLTATSRHYDAMVELIAPRGTIALIDDPDQLDVTKLKPRALTLHWGFMFTRSAFETADMVEQHRLLTRVADLVDAGRIATTANRDGGTITAINLRAAHAHQESGAAIGKTVLEGFEP